MGLVMRLSDFIAQEHDAIIADWVEFASTLRPWADGRSTQSLRDHAEELLVAVVSDMKAPQSAAEQSDKSQGMAPRGALARIGQQHAAQRLASGFDLEQLVSEYRALRASIMRLWAERQHREDADVTRFHEAIDESLTEAVVRYSEMLDRTREQFVGVLGHDLRSPLHTIVLGTTLLTQSKSLDEAETKIAERALGAAERMTRMVADLLDLTRTRLGTGIPVVLRAMDLSLVCARLIAELQIVYPQASVRFESPGPLLGEWDTDRLHQAISNLVANALQHGVRNGTVTVTAVARTAEVVLSVHNDGPMIPEDAIATVFDPMVREVNGHSDRRHAGLGLGLFIAREVAWSHGGSLTVASSAAGTTFEMRLPRHPPDDPRVTREPATG